MANPAPLALPLLPRSNFPVTLELFAMADPDGKQPTWSLTLKQPEIIGPPPFDDHWPCWLRVSYATGIVVEVPHRHDRW